MTPAAFILAALFIVLYLVLRFVSRSQFRWTFVSATMVAAIVYAAHVFLGSIVLILSVGHDPQGAAGYFVAFLGWLGLGTLDLMRMVPRTREPPAFLMKPGNADAICLIVILIGLGLAWD
jgi:hypothetical protein